MTNSENETVPVPVELLQRAIADGGQTDILDELRALLPKPTPRFVAVTNKQWYDGGGSPTWFESQPDLLILLDKVVDTTSEGETSEQLKLRIRAALGVAD